MIRAPYRRQGVVRGRSRLKSVTCLCIVLLLVLQSLGQLTLRDSITVAALATVGYLYFVRSAVGVGKK